MTGKSHHTLDSCPVVPGAVKQNDFAARRKMIHIALEVPLRAFFFGWLVQRNHPTNSRIQALSDPFNDAPFPAESRPSKRTQTRSPVASTQSCNLINSSCSFNNSLRYSHRSISGGRAD